MLSYMYGLERKEAFDDDKNVNFLKSKNGYFKVDTYANFFSFLLSLHSGDDSDHDSYMYFSAFSIKEKAHITPI